MPELIQIPDMKAPIGVALWAVYGVGGKKIHVDFSSGPKRSRWLKVPPGNGSVEVTIGATLSFPYADGKGNYSDSHGYFQTVEAVFDVIQSDGVPKFLVPELTLQPTWEGGPGVNQSPFRFLDGKVKLLETKDDRYRAVSITMVVGSADVVVESWEKSEEEGFEDPGLELEFGGDGDGGGGSKKKPGVIDTVRKLLPKVKWARKTETGNNTNTSGGSRTLQRLYQTREWILLLQLPEPKKAPQPVVYKEGFIFFVYFDTNQKTIGNYRDPRTKADQLKELMRTMDEQLAKYGEENITSIRISGHSSRVGDTDANLTLSEGRAGHVAEYLRRIYKMKIPENKIFPRGEPVTQGSDRDNSWKDRNAMVEISANRIVKQ